MHLLLGLFLMLTTACALAQRSNTTSSDPALPDTSQDSSAETSSAEVEVPASVTPSSLPDAPSYIAQPPSSDAPMLHTAQFLKLAMPNSSSGYSTLVFFGGGTSAPGSRQQLSQGTTTSTANCTRDAGAKTDGSGWITSLLSITSRGPHYCALGEGGFWKRGTYAMGRAFVAHSNDGAKAFNTSNLFPSGPAAGMTGGFSGYQGYAYQYDAGERMATRYATAVGRDVLKNLFREFAPDISSRVLRRHP